MVHPKPASPVEHFSDNEDPREWGLACWLFLVYAAPAIVAGVLARLGWMVLWTDIIRTNPHRTLQNALTSLPLVGTFVGVWLLLVLSIPLITVSVTAALFARTRGPNLQLFLGLILLGAIVIFTQEIVVFHFFPSDDPDASGLAERTAALLIHLLPGLTAGWWRLRWLNRQS